MTRVVFTPNPKNEWERSHSQSGLDGVTLVVEQACATPAILEYPPKDLGESFKAVFAGLDPEDVRKARSLPISKMLFLAQHAFLQKFSEPNRKAAFNRESVENWKDGEAPPVIQATFVTVPADEEGYVFNHGNLFPAATLFRTRFSRL